MRRIIIAICLMTIGLCASGLSGCSAGSVNESATATSVLATTPSSTFTAADGSAPSSSAPTPQGRENQAVPRLAPGDHEIALLHDGLERRYLLHIPPQLSSTTPPLIIALHGGGGHASQFRSDIGLDIIADREGFIVAYPDGTGPFPRVLHTWNAGYNCCGQAQQNNVDDVGFIRAVVTDLVTTLDIDTERVAVTGHSNGGIMAYRVAAEASDLISAAIPVSGAMALKDFAPASPVAILHIHSLDDPNALYFGGEGPRLPGTNSTIVHEPVSHSLSAWTTHNGCDPTPLETESSAEDDQSATYLHYRDCSNRGQVDHLLLTGVGHGWPGIETGRENRIGPATTLVSASEEVWRFASSVWND